MKPTKKQVLLLANIWRYKIQNHISPSFSEIKAMMNVGSYQSVINMLSRLELAGWIEREAGEARSILLTNQAKDYLMTIGVGQILNINLEVDGYSTNKIQAQFFDSTQANHNRAVANTLISYSAPNKSPVPQQLSLFDPESNITRSTSTTNMNNAPSFNTVAVNWLSGILDATSTAATTQAKQFVDYFFQGPLVQFVLLKRLTSFSFSEIIIVVAFSLIIFPFFINLIKGKYVTSN